MLRLWNSPTVTTWASIATRSLSLLIVLPLILVSFGPAETTLWYLLITVISLQLLVDLGFSSTFARYFAFATGGATTFAEFQSPETVTNRSPAGPDTMRALVGTMRVVYWRLSLASLGLMLLVGTPLLVRPISQTADPTASWASWAVVVVVTTAALFGNSFSAYLQGTNAIPQLRRWEAFTALGSIFSSAFTLLIGGGLFALVCVSQAWVIVAVARNFLLCRALGPNDFTGFSRLPLVPEIFSAVWPSAWRAGLGVIMSFGLVQASGVIYAQFGETAQVASYLLAMRLLQVLSEVSRAPFYSKLPTLAKLRALGDIEAQKSLAKRGMGLSLWTFVAGVVVLGLAGEPILKAIGSNTGFVAQSLWILLGTAFFIERYGAMHIQLYSTTNHIIWHVANGLSGVIYLIVTLILFRPIGVVAFPVAILASHLGFYTWYSTAHSYKAFDLKFWPDEVYSFAIPLAMLLTYALFRLV